MIFYSSQIIQIQANMGGYIYIYIYTFINIFVHFHIYYFYTHIFIFRCKYLKIFVITHVFIYLSIYMSPPDLTGGGTFVNFGPGEDVCQQMDRYTISIDNLYQKPITREAFASFEGHTKLSNLPF